MLFTLKSKIKGSSSFVSSFSSIKLDDNVKGDLGLGVVDFELGLFLGVLGDRSEQRKVEGEMGDRGGRKGALSCLDSLELMVELLLARLKLFFSFLFL